MLAGRGIQKRVPADASQVSPLRRAVEDFADANCELGDARSAVALCVAEACANVVCHAYPDGGGELSLVAWMDDHDLVVEIADEGIGLNGKSTNKGLGVGVQIMYQLADARISSDEQGTLVQLRFPLPEGGCEAARSF